MPNDPVDRREFARRLATGTAVVGAATAATAGDEAPKPKAAPAENPPGEQADDKPPPPAALLLELIRQQYPDKRLDDVAVQKGILKELRGDQARSARLARFGLKNADEPGFLFAAWRGDEG